MLVVRRPVPESLCAAEVIQRDGRAARLDTFWSGRPCTLLFLRHFGCVGCAEEATDLSPRLRDLETAGVRVVLVGNGKPEHMEGFVERHALGDKRVELVTDPSLAAFRAAHLVRSAWATWGPRAMVETARGMLRGIPHRPVDGDAKQQGGALLVDAEGVLRFYHRSVSIGDHVDANELVDAALSVTARTAAVRV